MSAKRKKERTTEGPPATPAALRLSESGSRNAILTPTLDFLSVGGLSLIVFIPLLLSGRSDLVILGAGAQAWITTCINMPHFMASYRLVYGSRAMIVRHRWASIYLPALLLLYVGVAVWEARYSQLMVYGLITVSSLYLAWHYTGQTWGMMASHGALARRAFDHRERRLVRLSLRLLLGWHVAWFLYTQLRDRSRVEWVYALASVGTVVAFVLGVVAFVQFRKRTGHWPASLALVAWCAIFVWYALMARDPKALFWVQIAHAVQYLAFPWRMELNAATQAQAAGAETRGGTSAAVVGRLALYAVALLAVSVLIAQVVPNSLMGIIGDAYGEDAGKSAPILLLMFINIHHYFTDGVLWRLRNPDVTRALFAHVAPVAGARSVSR